MTLFQCKKRMNKKWNNQLNVYEGPCSIDDVDALAKLSKAAIVIDHIQLISGFGHKTTRSLKQIAMKYKINIYILAQLNRSKDLFGTSTIQQDSDQIWFLHDQKCHLVKNRGGINKWFHVIHDVDNVYTCWLKDPDKDEYITLIKEYQLENFVPHEETVEEVFGTKLRNVEGQKHNKKDKEEYFMGVLIN
jgi:hypothetical protein